MTRAQLAAALRAFGVGPGSALMVHTRMSALGWVDGGSDTVVLALLDALGPEGTLAAYVPWQELTYGDDDRPPFDPSTAEAMRENGRIPERIRTWPEAVHSGHPDAGCAAVGARAAWLAGEGHRDNDPYGHGSPFARLAEAEGNVLMLGAPLDTITLLHHAEAIARSPRKRLVTYPVDLANGESKTFTHIDTEHGAFPYGEMDLSDDEFTVIARAALAAGIGKTGHVGPAESHLFPARELTDCAVAWLEDHFG